ncbi:MAG: Carboxylesterase NlhH [Alphaproteobacteria bacterium MarineAlpha12_Bin1]|jgi:acetyl esterase|nr:MAG: Carboxylesterase NlhH [Alphaproteobacteria bacterium MarineAlpha12_Bin1]|tara:strand:- start:2861 stop:3793 length:933 start_codon:yes stop_codon:yes gene_type:complete
MYVDPQIKKFVEELASQEAPHPVEMGLEAAREGFSQLWRMVNPENRELERNEDLFIPGPSGDIRCKLYVPKGTTGPLPILAYFHGGGMCLMSPEDFEGTNTIISDDAKCIVVVPDYRLAPENPFPAPLEDCYATLRWLQENADSIGGDSSRIAIAGDSGGGYLTAAVSLEAKLNNTPQPILQILIYPMIDMAGISTSRVEETLFLDDRTLQWVISMHAGDNRLDPRASPIHATDVSGLAPALIIAADIDPLRDEGRAYASKLQKAGVTAHYQLYRGVVHGFFNFGSFSDQANLAVQNAISALKSAFNNVN